MPENIGIPDAFSCPCGAKGAIWYDFEIRLADKPDPDSLVYGSHRLLCKNCLVDWMQASRTPLKHRPEQDGLTSTH